MTKLRSAWVSVVVVAFAAACGSSDNSSGSDASVGGANAIGGAGGSSGTECVVGDQRSCDQGGLYGRCAAGTQTCQTDGVWGSCSIQPAATDGCEPGNDDDCDGTPNEGCTCVAGQIRSCAQSGALGNCAAGEQSCESDGAWGPCSILPASGDDCAVSGDDANCNGTPNEDCPCASGETQPCGSTPEVGQCHAGESSCTDGSWGACEGVVYPATRDCSSADDNDCDGVADDVLDDQCRCAPAATEGCDTHHGLDGVGSCQAGSRTCTAVGDGSLSDWSGCVGSVGPLNEVCDGAADENCDGQVDEGCGGTGGTGGTTGGAAGSGNGATSGTATGGTSGGSRGNGGAPAAGAGGGPCPSTPPVDGSPCDPSLNSLYCTWGDHPVVTVYGGHGCRTVASCARTQEPSWNVELAPEECSLLAGCPPDPTGTCSAYVAPYCIWANGDVCRCYDPGSAPTSCSSWLPSIEASCPSTVVPNSGTPCALPAGTACLDITCGRTVTCEEDGFWRWDMDNSCLLGGAPTAGYATDASAFGGGGTSGTAGGL